MSDRSEEVTTRREPTSTEDLLEETESLLSESGYAPAEPTAGEGGGVDDRDQSVREDSPTVRSPERGSVDGPASDDQPSSTTSDRSRWNPLRLAPSPAQYFSAKAFVGLVLVFVLGMVLAGSFVPLVGGSVGLFAAAFLVGLVDSTRRYLEVTTAGTGVALGAATMDYALFALLGGGTLLAISTAIGVIAAIAGYYFGRDLRSGLTRDI